MSILKKVHKFVTKPMHSGQMGNLLNWIGKIKINKDISIIITGQDNRRYKKTIHGNKETLVTFVELSEIMTKVIQEGPEEMRYNYNAEGVSRMANPLKVTIIDNENICEDIELDNSGKKSPKRIPKL